MDGLTELIAAFGQTGLPIALIGWGVWIITAKLIPWFTDKERRELDRAVENGKSQALMALADAIVELAKVIERSA